MSIDILYLAELIVTPYDGNIPVTFGKSPVLFLATLAFSSSPFRYNFLFEDEESE